MLRGQKIFRSFVRIELFVVSAKRRQFDRQFSSGQQSRGCMARYAAPKLSPLLSSLKKRPKIALFRVTAIQFSRDFLVRML